MVVDRRESGPDRWTLARRALLAATFSVGCTIVVGGDGSDTDNAAADSSGAPATGGTSSTNSPTTTTTTTTAADESSSSTTTAGTTTDTPTGPTGSDCDPGRVDFDRPDDHPDVYQVHVNYVLPGDGFDEQLDLDDRIVTSVAAFQAWFAAQADGRQLRFDTCDGALDIRFIRLSQSEATLRAEGVFIRDAIEAEMMAAGQISATKLELVYYGGDADSTCGGGPYPPNLIGRVGALYLKGTFDDPNVPPCASNPVGASIDQPGYVDFSALHELLHALGLAPGCAPHHTMQGHVSDSPQDLMYAGAEPWTPSNLDLGRDDYLDHGIPECPDLGRSVFLEPLPVDAEPPPGW